MYGGGEYNSLISLLQGHYDMHSRNLTAAPNTLDWNFITFYMGNCYFRLRKYEEAI